MATVSYKSVYALFERYYLRVGVQWYVDYIGEYNVEIAKVFALSIEDYHFMAVLKDAENIDEYFAFFFNKNKPLIPITINKDEDIDFLDFCKFSCKFKEIPRQEFEDLVESQCGEDFLELYHKNTDDYNGHSAFEA